ncbi:MAG: hypothetical protein V7603_6608 [Micromonosporaceae bacterium]
MPVVCRSCGKSNPDGTQFCGNPECGSYLPWSGRGDAAPQPPPTPVTGEPPARPVAESQSAAATLTLSDATLSASPGDTATTTVTIHNGGTQVERFAVRVLGPTANWVSVEPPVVTVYPGVRSDCTVRFTPPKRPDTAPGRAPFTVLATSELHPGLSVAGNGFLNVGAYRGLTAVMSPQGTSGRWRTVHAVDIVNTGNVIEPVSLRADDPAGRLRFAVPAGELPLPPGPHRINLPVRPQPRLVGKPQRYPFQVTVTPRQPVPPIRLDGSREAVPLVAGWVPAAVAAAVALLVLAGVAFAVTGGKLPWATAGAASPAASGAAPTGGAPATGAPPASQGPSMSAPPSMAASSAAPVMHLPQRFEVESLLDRATVGGGAQITNQDSGCCGIPYSGGAQVLVKAPAGGAFLTVRFTVAAAGRFALLMGQTMAPDYGFTSVFVDGHEIGHEFNGFFPTVTNTPPLRQGDIRLSQGTHTLKLVINTRDASSTGYNAGFDFFELARAGTKGGQAPSPPPPSSPAA